MLPGKCNRTWRSRNGNIGINHRTNHKTNKTKQKEENKRLFNKQKKLKDRINKDSRKENINGNKNLFERRMAIYTGIHR